jgi:hypothetical protein
MSYRAACVGCLGTIDPWDSVTLGLHRVAETDVIVLRLRVANVRMKDPSDALLFARAAGQGQNWGMDVRGVVVAPVAGSDDQMVDVVFTKGDAGLFGWSPSIMVGFADNADSMGAKVAADETLRQNSPQLAIVSAQLGPLTDPADAIDHWRSQPIAWDHLLNGPKNAGGPTDTFATPADYTVCKGTADDGKRCKPWKAGVLPFGPNGPTVTPTQIGVVAGAAVLGLIVWKLVTK